MDPRRAHRWVSSSGPAARRLWRQLPAVVRSRDSEASAFAMLTHGDLRLLLSAPGGEPGGGQVMPDGTLPTPGGWNRFSIKEADLAGTVDRLRVAGVHLRTDLITGVGGRQVVIDDPSRNPIELFEPTRTDASDQPVVRQPDRWQASGVPMIWGGASVERMRSGRMAAASGNRVMDVDGASPFWSSLEPIRPTFRPRRGVARSSR